MEIRSLLSISAPLLRLLIADAALVIAAGWCRRLEHFPGGWRRTTHGVVRRSARDRGWLDPEEGVGPEGPWGLRP